MRVISLLPSATETLCLIGGGELLVGRSHECNWPPEISSLPVLTDQTITANSSVEIDAQVREQAESGAASLYTLDEDLLRELEPDLIITQDLCDVCSIDLNTVHRVAKDIPSKPKVLSLNPSTLFDVFDDVLTVGKAVDLEAAADRAMVSLRGDYWSAVDFVNPYVPGPEVLFLEWIEPPFVGGHWTPGLIEAAGGRHSANADGAKSRQVTPEEIIALAPDRIIVCPCGRNLEDIETELDRLRESSWWQFLPAVIDQREDAIVMIDGDAMFNRPGPRLVAAFRWLVAWINDRPEILPEGFPVRPIRG